MNDAIAILSTHTPEGLFDKNNIKQSFRDLVRVWHPDVNKDPLASEVFAHISKLYSEAVVKDANRAWGYAGFLELTSLLGVTYKIKYLFAEVFELGTMYVNDTIVMYVVDKSHRKLYDNFISVISNFKFPSDRIKKEFEKHLPTLKVCFETTDSLVICVNKTPDVLPLKVVHRYFNSEIDPRSAAWIMSNMHNMLCFLHYNKLAHNDISTSTYFISPEYHSGLLLGGWWYATPNGTKLKSVPRRTYEYMNNKSKLDKLAYMGLDSELIRATCREILGDKNGVSLVSKLKVPIPFAQWVRLPGSTDPIKDYGTWSDKILKESFGPKKFIPMEIDTKVAYGNMPMINT